MRVRVLVFNATFNNISVISWWSVLFVENTNFSSGLMNKLSPVLAQLSNTLSREINSIAILLEKGVEMADNCAVAR
jgi:hypothetical protein